MSHIYGYTQKEVLEIVKLNLEKGTSFINKYGDAMSDCQRAYMLCTVNDMIKARTRTPEQIERDNERRREVRAKKRVQRDDEIRELILPYLTCPRTASELETLTSHKVSAGEIRSFFQRNAANLKVDFINPRTEYAYKVRD